MLKLETLRTEEELDRLKPRWEWLEKQCGGTLFQNYELNRRAAVWFSNRETPHVIVAESDSGIAIIPAVRREREFGLIGETLFDYRDVLSAGDPKVLEFAWRHLSLMGLPLEVTALRGLDAKERWKCLNPTEFCNAPTTRCQDISPDEFVAAHKKAAKASRRLAREGLRLIKRDQELKTVAEWIYRRKAEWTGASENLFADTQRQNFMLSIILDNVLGCNTWSYEDDNGNIAAALVTFQHEHHRHFYTIHHDDRWEKLSPGQVLIFDVTRESLKEGLNVDFMTGEYPYKNRLATAFIPLFRIAATIEQMASWNIAAPRMVMPAA